MSSLLNARESEPTDAEDNALDVDMSSSDVDMTSSDDSPPGQQDRSHIIIIIRQRQREMITQSLSSGGAINSMLCSVKAMFSYVLTCSRSTTPMRVTTIGR